MKVISLNTWGGKIGKEKFFNFIEKYKNTDVFCFQEVWSGGHHADGMVSAGRIITGVIHELAQELSSVLKDHTLYFRPHYSDFFGIAIFVKKNIEIVEEGEFFVYQEKGYMPANGEDYANHARNVQYITFKTASGLQTIINFHGTWDASGKGDTEKRLKQTDRMLDFLKNITTPRVLCGDFNVMPDTESLKRIENTGLINLIKEYKITSTRTSFYTKPERFADYMLVSKEIKVKEFKILPEEISDHTAMYLEFV